MHSVKVHSQSNHRQSVIVRESLSPAARSGSLRIHVMQSLSGHVTRANVLRQHNRGKIVRPGISVTRNVTHFSRKSNHKRHLGAASRSVSKLLARILTNWKHSDHQEKSKKNVRSDSTEFPSRLTARTNDKETIPPIPRDLSGSCLSVGVVECRTDFSIKFPACLCFRKSRGPGFVVACRAIGLYPRRDIADRNRRSPWKSDNSMARHSQAKQQRSRFETLLEGA